MAKTLTSVFEEYLGHIKFDKKLVSKIAMYRLGWVTKAPMYSEFLGGALLGVQAIRFSTLDADMFFIDILGVDQAELQQELYTTPGITKEWEVSSNVVNLTISYLMHKFTTSELNHKDKMYVVSELYYIFAYRIISSLVWRRFKLHDAEISLAKATYEKLSNRFILKKMGSWQKFFEYRASDVLGPKGLYFEGLHKFDAEDTVLMINDLQGRIRDVVTKIYSIMLEIRDAGDDTEVVKTTTLLGTDTEGEETIGGITNRTDKYIVYLYDIINKPNDFINDDVMEIVLNVLPNLDPAIFKGTLRHISEHMNISAKHNDIVAPIITHNIAYLTNKGITNNYVDNIVEVLTYIKGYWSSSRVVNKDVVKVKKEIFNMVKKSTKKKTKWVLTTATIGVVLYIFFRGMVKK